MGLVADARVFALVDRHASVRERIARSVQALIIRLWRQFNGHYSDRAVALFAAEAAQVVRAGQVQTATLTQSYLLLVLAEMGAGPRQPSDLRLAEDLRSGVTADEEWERVVRGFRYLRSNGVSLDEALERSETRAAVLAGYDLSLAMREASRQTLQEAPAVSGWRRIIHPELSKSGTCGLCVVAADRVYRVEELLPLHGRCKCTVLPIVGADDPGSKLNAADLKGLYAAAGSTAAEDLKRTRYKVQQHGELGPVLARAGDHWRGAAEVEAGARS